MALSEDNRHLVVPTKVEDGVNLQTRLIRHIADAPVLDGLSHFLGVDSTRHRWSALAKPDVLVIFFQHRALGVSAFSFHRVVEPRVFRVVHLQDEAIVLRVLDEILVGGVGIQFGVHRHPDFRSFLSDGRGQDVK